MGKSRLKNSIKNLQAAWIGQFLNVFAKFVMRRFFVRYFQSEGMVKLARGTVEITDTEKLRQMT